MTSLNLFQNTFILRRPGAADFVDIIKFAKTQKIKRIRHYSLKYNLCLYFPIQQKLLISSKKLLLLAKLMGSVT